MKNYQITFLLILTLSLKAFSQTTTLEVHITNFENDLGQAVLVVYNSEESFPTKAEGIVLTKKVNINKGTAVFTITELNLGEYAFMVFHDENKDNNLDVNIIGMPKEGVVASNNAKGTMGPPKYRDAKFILSSSPLKVTLKMNYL